LKRVHKDTREHVKRGMGMDLPIDHRSQGGQKRGMFEASRKKGT